VRDAKRTLDFLVRRAMSVDRGPDLKPNTRGVSACVMSKAKARRLPLAHALGNATEMSGSSGAYSVKESANSPWRFFASDADEPSWDVRPPWFDGQDSQVLRSSRVVVNKTDGRVSYDGSANDEG
jgi:hypothetical protein